MEFTVGRTYAIDEVHNGSRYFFVLWDFDYVEIVRLKHTSEPIFAGLLSNEGDSDGLVHFFPLIPRKDSSFQVLQDGRFEEILSIMKDTSSKVRNLKDFAYNFDAYRLAHEFYLRSFSSLNT